jgi:small subunit ribosomal protein S17
MTEKTEKTTTPVTPATPPTPTTSEGRPAKRRTIQGTVVSRSMKTINVSHERRVQHPRYKKYIRRVSKYLAHDEKDEAQIGDKVLLMECRPISKRKNWRLVQILSKAKSLVPENAEATTSPASAETPPK